MSRRIIKTDSGAYAIVLKRFHRTSGCSAAPSLAAVQVLLPSLGQDAYFALVSEARFIGEPIAVTTDGDVKEPKSFEWRGRAYAIVELMQMWSDWGFAQGSVQRNWRTRRHRNYYRVRVESGEVFELYNDRGIKPGQGEWYLLQQIDHNAVG